MPQLKTFFIYATPIFCRSLVMQRILVVEDSLETQIILRECLRSFEVIQATSLKAAHEALSQYHFDLMILDIELPDGDGLKFFTALKNQSHHLEIPVVFLSSRAQTEDIVIGFQLGADDYITKPFNIFEFRARIEARLLKLKSNQHEDSHVRVLDLFLDLEKHQVFRTSNTLEKINLNLTPLEFKILLFMARHYETVFSRDQLINHIWGNGVALGDRVVDTHISNLRKKLSQSDCLLSSVYGSGYRLEKRSSAA